MMLFDNDTQIDENIINSLLSFCDLGGFAPGALLYNFVDDSKTKQLKCIKDVLKQNNIQYVLETGTESGMFSYFARCVNPDIKVVTFGMNEGHNPTTDKRSEVCTGFLNKTFGNYIEYIEGDSRNTLTNFIPKIVIQFAWVDGGHTRDICMSDLNNCKRLHIPHICVDDYNMISEVRETVEQFLIDNPEYQKQFVTDEERGICYIKLVDVN